MARIWNLIIDGFGDHDPGSGRRNLMRSSWDVLHPGRPWANKLKPNTKSEQQILANLAEFIAGHPAQIVDDPEAGDEPEDADEDEQSAGT